MGGIDCEFSISFTEILGSFILNRTRFRWRKEADLELRFLAAHMLPHRGGTFGLANITSRSFSAVLALCFYLMFVYLPDLR